ncbi:unnamed protein product [Ranitomeya imitator]|uniref:Rho-GAP domain-containing protein n=1 Tax=Ranitomeya imitator TaxID=111125 RepID=A0ABN9LGT5_9NEOB|nr:unnamed protein product [Ranitomeya imitator]
MGTAPGRKKNKPFNPPTRRNWESNYFGKPLPELVSPEKPIPVFVKKCVDFIEESGLGTEGLYRVSGYKTDQDNIQKLFDQVGDQIISTNVFYKDLCFRTEEGVKGVSFFVVFDSEEIRVVKKLVFFSPPEIPDRIDRLHALKTILRNFPSVNYEVLKYIISHLNSHGSGAGVLCFALLRAEDSTAVRRRRKDQRPDACALQYFVCPQQGRAKYACAGAVAEDQKRTSCNEDGRRRSGPETPIRPDQQQWAVPGVSQHSKTNLMTADNLSICFWPTLMRPDFENKEFFSTTKNHQSVIENFIQQCQFFFYEGEIVDSPSVTSSPSAQHSSPGQLAPPLVPLQLPPPLQPQLLQPALQADPLGII